MYNHTYSFFFIPAKATKNVISLGLNWLHIALAIFLKLYGLVIKGIEEVG